MKDTPGKFPPNWDLVIGRYPVEETRPPDTECRENCRAWHQGYRRGKSLHRKSQPANKVGGHPTNPENIGGGRHYLDSIVKRQWHSPLPPASGRSAGSWWRNQSCPMFHQYKSAFPPWFDSG